MQTTISLKVSTDLLSVLKKASKLRGISMSDLIRQNLQNNYLNKSKITSNEPEIFKYFGVFKEDKEIKEFEKNLKQSRKTKLTKSVEF